MLAGMAITDDKRREILAAAKTRTTENVKTLIEAILDVQWSSTPPDQIDEANRQHLLGTAPILEYATRTFENAICDLEFIADSEP